MQVLGEDHLGPESTPEACFGRPHILPKVPGTPKLSLSLLPNLTESTPGHLKSRERADPRDVLVVCRSCDLGLGLQERIWCEWI